MASEIEEREKKIQGKKKRLHDEVEVEIDRSVEDLETEVCASFEL